MARRSRVVRWQLAWLGAILLTLGGQACAAGDDRSFSLGAAFISLTLPDDQLVKPQRRDLRNAQGQPLKDTSSIGTGGFLLDIEGSVSSTLSMGLRLRDESGSRQVDVDSTQTFGFLQSTYKGVTYEEDVRITSYELALTWLPTGWKVGRNKRFGMTLGGGPAEYEYKQRLFSTSNTYSVCSKTLVCHQSSETTIAKTGTSVHGQEVEIGPFFEFRGKTWAGRIGVEWGQLQFPDLHAPQPGGGSKTFQVGGLAERAYVGVWLIL